MKYKFPILRGEDIDGRAFPEFVWNADLIYFDGPLLSLFKQERGEDALFFWLDTDTRRHRWGVVDVDRRQLAAYLGGSLALREIIRSASEIFVFEATPKGRRSKIVRMVPSALPPHYWPSEDSFLTDRIATDAAVALRQETAKRYELKLSGDDIYIDDLAAIPRVYEQLYSFIYGLEHLNRPAVRERIIAAVKNWTGGFAAVNLFSGLKSVIPSVHRARISDMHYASPGQIGMELLPDMAVRIAEAVDKLGSCQVEAEQTYRDCYSYFRDQNLSGFEEGSERRGDSLSPAQAREIERFLNVFLSLLGLESFDASFSSLEIDALGRLRALLAFYRRLKRLRSYVDKGTLKVPKRASVKSP
jgi:hypothetical protein